ncbi:hypothetical protein GSI_00255 [Ganoderma sinense ZZ0214-1]|uniref:Uncharacterized protein n=1 Tax=Ganoderma sinense ZZ0214-1 TaxID=1077348 RepID=A0A2G8SS18_9APHY|nr:hypothetical protein GSI_00255 [Ganoderma sinense ZZ0214-1]
MIPQSLQPKVQVWPLEQYMLTLNQNWGYPFHFGVSHKEPLKSQKKKEDQAELECQKLAKILIGMMNLMLEPLESLVNLKDLEDLEDQEVVDLEAEDLEDQVVEDPEDQEAENLLDLLEEIQTQEAILEVLGLDYLWDLQYLTLHQMETRLRSKHLKHLMEIETSCKTSLINCFFSSWETLPNTSQAIQTIV